MKKIILFLAVMVFLLAPQPALAKKEEGRGSQSTRSGEARWLQQIRKTLKQRFAFLLPTGVNRATITAISGTTFPAEVKVKKESEEIILKISDQTILLRKFGGQFSLSEMHLGDIVTARGTWLDAEKVILETRVLRDLSLQKRNGTFWGEIKSLEVSEKSFVLETSKRGDQTVLVIDSTEIFDRRQRLLDFADLAVGHRVRVTGLWDSTQKTIEEVKSIKDWSIGPNPTVSPTP